MDKPKWFDDWADYHFELFPRSDWPSFKSPFWDEWFCSIEGLRCDPMFVMEASRLLFKNPPAFIGDHPKAHVEKIKQLVREAAASNPVMPVKGDLADREWNRGAEAKWAVQTEEEKDVWRQLARERLPGLIGRPGFLEGVAKGWCYDPTMVVGMPPKPSPSYGGGIHQAFEDRPAPRQRGVDEAIRYLTGVLRVAPMPLETIVSEANNFNIAINAIWEASRKLGVIKADTEGEQVWSLPARLSAAS